MENAAKQYIKKWQNSNPEKSILTDVEIQQMLVEFATIEIAKITNKENDILIISNAAKIQSLKENLESCEMFIQSCGLCLSEKEKGMLIILKQIFNEDNN